KHPRPAAAPAGHATTDPDRRGRARQRSVVGIGSRILEHALTVEWRRRWIAKRRPDLVAREVPGKTEPSHDLAQHPTLERVQDCSAHILAETARIAVLIPIRPAEQLPHRELPERRSAVSVGRHEDEVGRPATRLAIARVDAVASGP